MTDIREDIKAALKKCGQTPNFKAAATELLQTLGYSSERTLELDGSPTQFMNEYPPPPPPRDKQRSQGEVRFKGAAKLVHIVFQYTKEEATKTSQDAIEGSTFNTGTYQSFLFFAVELKPNEYARGQYAEFTREINKRFSMPVVVLFRTKISNDSRLTLAFVERRPSKKDNDRDVLQKVSLLREIECAKPHRGHLDILAELSLKERMKWIDANKKPKNFKGLLDAWINQLDTDALNKRFYNDLFGWFERARAEIQFPENLHKKREDWIIRLITRLLFVWFIKEKGLVDDKLFTKGHIETLLEENPDDDSYYRVVLQNLFFATLNTPIKNRGFSKKNHKSHRDFSLYRYKDEIATGRASALLDLFAKTPFINGGLFDCLDDYNSPKSEKNSGRKGGGERIDYFSDVHDKKLSLPNCLFFDGSGLLTIFNRYKFTVEESTPVEQEVALDPELLGQVFENLLAAYNPETRGNARKQTGSYYTPREIVDYMVGQSLMSYLAEKTQPENRDTKLWQEQLDYLLDYHDAFNDADELFQENERKSIVRAISKLRTLDPAVGSGAFPMGILHRLSLVLRRLDPKNEEWHALQKERAQKDAGKVFNDQTDKAARKERLDEINETFTRYSSGFGRKLFLIQNSIFGADIQPVACQIAKLRFFISLAIEQKANKDKNNNYGIKPLPNLETRFVAANTLIKISKPQQGGLQPSKVGDLESKLKQNRERYFNAVSRGEKLRCRDVDQGLRKELATELKVGGWEEKGSTRIAEWDLYDQNAAADWFDAEWMFGIPNGFDITIGNPPYVKTEHLSEEEKESLKSAFGWTDDLYVHFIFKGMELTRPNGVCSYIANDSFITLSGKERVRNLLLKNKMLSLAKCPEETFNATIYAAIFIVVKGMPVPSHEYQSGAMLFPGYAHKEYGNIRYDAVSETPGHKFLFASPMLELYQRMVKRHKKVEQYLSVLDTGIDSGNVRKKIFFAEDASGQFSRLLQGRQTGRFYINWNDPRAKYRFCDITYSSRSILGIGRGGAPSKRNEYWGFRGSIENHQKPERLLIRQTADNIVVAYHSEKHLGQFYTDNTLFTIFLKTDNVNLKYAMAILNSKLINALYQFITLEKGKTLPQVKIRNVIQLPFAAPLKAEQRPFIELAEKITAAKAANPDVDTSGWEAEVDRLVYALYGLTESEIKIIEATG